MRGYNYGNTMLTSFVCEMSNDGFDLLEKCIYLTKKVVSAPTQQFNVTNK